MDKQNLLVRGMCLFKLRFCLCRVFIHVMSLYMLYVCICHVFVNMYVLHVMRTSQSSYRTDELMVDVDYMTGR